MLPRYGPVSYHSSVSKLGDGKRKLRQTREGTGHQPRGLGANPRGCSLPYRNTRGHLHKPLFLHKNHDFKILGWTECRFNLWFSILDSLLTLTPRLSSFQMKPDLKFWYVFHYPSVWSGHSRWLLSCSRYIPCSTSPCFTNMHPHDYLILLIIRLNRSRAAYVCLLPHRWFLP